MWRVWRTGAAAAAALALTAYLVQHLRRKRERRQSEERLRAAARPLTSAGAMMERLKRIGTLAEMITQRTTSSPKSRFQNRFLGSDHSANRTFRVLSLDGGGTRGAFSMRLLQRLVKEYPDLLDEIDIIAGTSTGSLLAILLSLGYSADETLDIFCTAAPKIFAPSPWWRRWNPLSAKFSGKAKHDIFERIGADATLADLDRYVMLTAFCMGAEVTTPREVFYGDAGRWHPGVMTNLPQRGSRVPTDGDVLLKDAAMRTTAAPTYFPIYQGFVDGGVFANNPSLCSLARLLDTFPESARLENIAVLSIGTGAQASSLPCQSDDEALGPLQWAPHALQLMSDANQDAVNFNMRMLLGDRYCRVDDYMPRLVPMDDASPKSIASMLAAADSVDLSNAMSFVERHFLERQPQSRPTSEPDLLFNMKNSFGDDGEGDHELFVVPPSRASAATDQLASGEVTPVVKISLAGERLLPGQRYRHSDGDSSDDEVHQMHRRLRPFRAKRAPSLYDMPNEAFDGVIAASEDWGGLVRDTGDGGAQPDVFGGAGYDGDAENNGDEAEGVDDDTVDATADVFAEADDERTPEAHIQRALETAVQGGATPPANG